MLKEFVTEGLHCTPEGVRHVTRSDLAGDVDEGVPRDLSLRTEHLQVQQGTLAVAVVELVLKLTVKTNQTQEGTCSER